MKGKATFKNKRAPVRAVTFGADLPWSTIKIVEHGAVRAYVDADQRLGPMKVALRGAEVPPDLAVHISENHQGVTEANATWSFRSPRAFTLFPRDQRILDPRKATDKDARRFQRLYFLFESAADDCEFYVQVTFPEEEQLEIRRKIQAEQLAAALDGALAAKELSTEFSADATDLELKAMEAEERFKAINLRVIKERGLDKYFSDIDFIEKNRLSTHETSNL